ncbi:MAG: AtpZ/AtpI family protein [Anaerolineaceae bacterium]|jgi:MFS-type transporter involved in bile tolerance (Atg22 family)
MSSPGHSNHNRKTDLFHWALLGMIGQVGCVTFVIILAVIFLGLWLDSQFGTRPVITFTLVIASIPASILIMLFLVRKGVERIKDRFIPGIKNEEEKQVGTDT